MSQWPKPFQKPYPPIIVGGAFPYAAQRAIRYGNGWIPRADRLEHDGVGVVIKKFRDMAIEAGRDPASLPITHLPRARRPGPSCASARRSASTASSSACRRKRRTRSCRSSTAGCR